MKLFARLFPRKPARTFPALSVDTMIRTRAIRVCNRKPELIAAYVRRQTILAQGVKR